MNTRETYNKMPEVVRNKIDDIKRRNKIAKEADRWHERRRISAEASGYFTGLRDAGLITERERQILYIYATI